MKLVEKRVTLNFPPQFNLIHIKIKNRSKSLFYCYNNKYYYKFSADKFFFNANLNCVIVQYNTEILHNTFDKKFFLKFMKSLDCYFFLKISFKGKGYKIKFFKKKKIIKFYFGRSHKTFMKHRRIIIKKYLKYKYVLKTPNIEYLNYVCALTKSIRPLNVFTLRGIRTSRSVVYKRKGRKNSLIIN